MSETAAFYIVTVAGGKCLENTQGNQGVLDCLPKDSDKQKWVLEPSENDPNVVAIKNCADGKYLVNTQPHAINGAKIGMRDEKQLWTIENGRFPRSCTIRSNACTVGASYLNDFRGEYKDNHYVHMWQMEKTLDWWLTWYLIDATSSGSFNPMQESQVTSAASSKDLEAREKALAEKEQSLAEGKRDNEERDAKLQERESKVADQEEKAKALAEKQKSVDEKEKNVSEQEEDVKRREAALKDRESKGAERDLADKAQRTSDNGKQADEMKRKEAALEERERKIAEQEAALEKAGDNDAKPSSQDEAPKSNGQMNGDSGKDTHEVDLLKSENENLRLKLQIKDLENELEKARQQPQSSSPKSTASANSKAATPTNGTSMKGSSSPSTNGTTSSPSGPKQSEESAAAKSKGPIVFSCGHVVYPPPKKVGRKIIGYMYEGMNQPHAPSARQQAALTKSGL